MYRLAFFVLESVELVISALRSSSLDLNNVTEENKIFCSEEIRSVIHAKKKVVKSR